MNADRWHQVTGLYHAARERADEERRAFLDSACRGDDDLRREVESMLAADAACADGFFTGQAAQTLDNLTVTPGMTLGSYRIDRLLGRGGMGAVFLAYDTTLHRPVALKLMDETSSSSASGNQLLREARSAAALNHPNICTIHEVSRSSAATYIAMEFVEGRSLRERIDEGALTPAETVHLGIQAADALAYAHDHGVIHRDFKAANVMITGDSRLKIVDFGLARRDDPRLSSAMTMSSIMQPGVIAGTPYVMAPEQARGEVTDARTDIWALGVLLYEMVTGVRAFAGASTADTLAAVLRAQPKPPNAIVTRFPPANANRSSTSHASRAQNRPTGRARYG